MALSLRQLQAFVAVSETGNFTRAGEQLGLAQPVVSGLIRELEAELGFRLFDRTTRRVVLTPMAEDFRVEAADVLDELSQIVRRARTIGARKAGEISIGAPPFLAAALLPPTIRRFSRHLPDVRLIVVDRPVDVILDMVTRNALQIGIGTFGATGAALNRMSLLVDDFALFCAEDYWRSHPKPTSWADLSRLPQIMLERGNSIRNLVDQGFARAGHDADVAFEVSQISTILPLVAQGLGVSILPTYMMRAPGVPGLNATALPAPGIAREVSILSNADRSLPPVAADFLADLKQTARELGMRSALPA